MGLLSGAAGLLSAGARLLGIGGTAVGTVGARAGLLGGLARSAPSLAGGVGGGLAFGGISSLIGGLFGGGGGAAPVGPGMLAPTGLNRSTFVTLDNGARILVAPSGRMSVPTIFIPAGAKMPAGHNLVFIGPNGDLFGLRKKRKKRDSFAVQVNRTKELVKDAKALIAAVSKK